MRIALLALGATSLMFLVAAPAAAQLSKEAQIAAALTAAPVDRRDGARVLGYDANGRITVLREGSNDLICLADNPAVEGFEADCYHSSLEPFMARGRELAEQNVPGADRNRIRYEEADNGRLAMPDVPAMLYIVSGGGFDAATGTVAQEYRRQVIYIPYATAESTGLSPQASSTEPWIMFPGTAGAHIMITPPRPRPGG